MNRDQIIDVIKAEFDRVFYGHLPPDEASVEEDRHDALVKTAMRAVERCAQLESIAHEEGLEQYYDS